jgi:hypothetical protein
MTQFKVGDRARIIDAYMPKNVGDIITVAYVQDEDDYVLIGSAEDGEASWLSSRYELVEGFVKGDKVYCVDAGDNPRLTTGNVYEVVEDQDGGCNGWVETTSDDGLNRSYFAYRFKLADDVVPALELAEVTEAEPIEVKRTLTLTYGGVSIDLDPSIPFSRKFAEAFLNAVYN